MWLPQVWEVPVACKVTRYSHESHYHQATHLLLRKLRGIFWLKTLFCGK